MSPVDRPQESPAALPRGTPLAGHEIMRVVSHSDHAIVYEAVGAASWTRMAIKEYAPEALATRDALGLRPRTEASAEAYHRGLTAFIDEARQLARLKHPALLPVTQVWEANGTAYRAMPWLAGERLLDLRLQMATPPDDVALRALLSPLLGALQVLHDAGLVHGAVSPEKILLGAGEQPVLMDFSAVRRALADGRTSAFTHATRFMAPEQREGGSIGPWTDLYSLAATALFALVGPTPRAGTAGLTGSGLETPEAMLRRALAERTSLRISEPMWAVLRAALEPDAFDRPDSVALFRARLTGVTPRAASPFRERPAPAVASPLVDKPVDTAGADPLPPRAAVPEPTPAALEVSPPAVEAALPAETSQPSAAVAPPPAPPLATAAPAGPKPQDRKPEVPMPDGTPEADPGPELGLDEIEAAMQRIARVAREQVALPPLPKLRHAHAERRPTEDPTPVASLARMPATPGAAPSMAKPPESTIKADPLPAAGGPARTPTASRPQKPQPPQSGKPAAPRPAPWMTSPWGWLAGAGVLLVVGLVAWWLNTGDSAPRTTRAAAPDGAASGAKGVKREPTRASQSAIIEAVTGVQRDLQPATPRLDAEAADSLAGARVLPADASPEASANRKPRTSANGANGAVAAGPAAMAPVAPNGLLTSPRAACGDRTQFSLYRCMQSLCETKRWQAHAQCVKLRETDQVD